MPTKSETRQDKTEEEATAGTVPSDSEKPHRPRTTAASTESTLRTEAITLNVGPQHPSTHGVLHVRVELDGEVIKDATPVIGYLHRGFEKLAERGYTKAIPLTDRLDYVNGWGNELGYVLAVEKLLGIEVPERAQIIRVMLAEMVRITSHHIWYGTYGLDMGALTPILYAWREREMLYDLFEEYSGARMMYNFMRFGGLARDLPDGWIEKAADFVEKWPAAVDEYEAMLTNNEVFRRRTMGISVMTSEEAIAWGVTGPPRIMRMEHDEFRPRKHRLLELAERAAGKTGDAPADAESFAAFRREVRELAEFIEDWFDKALDVIQTLDEGRIRSYLTGDEFEGGLADIDEIRAEINGLAGEARDYRLERDF